MYPLLLEDGSSRYFTKDGVIAYKEKLDKKLKRYSIMNAIKWGLFVFFITYIISYLISCCLLSSRVDNETYHTITRFLHKRWNKINTKCNGGILGIQSLMNGIEASQY